MGGRAARSGRRLTSLLATAALASAALFAGSVDAKHAGDASPGPRLTAPRAKLRGALQCTDELGRAARKPVLLIPGTTATPRENYSWNWEPALTAADVPWCALLVPHHSMDDIQVAAEYIVHAIRRMHRVSGRRIAIMGQSQGGMSPRWVLRFWPAIRGMVDDLIGFAPSNHGARFFDAACFYECAPSPWQQRTDSEFIRALNSPRQTFPGISYTNVYSHTDEVATPNSDDTGVSSLHGGGGRIANVAIQDVCPLDLNEHIAIGTWDPVAHALAIDALEHRGPARPARVDSAVCAETFMPGVDPVGFPSGLASLTAVITLQSATYPRTRAEPRLACYARPACRARRSGTR
jgi:hypothetical protein